MPVHKEQKHLPYTPEQMFDLVADVNKYPQFLPWCIACRKTLDTGAMMEADLIIGYKMIREKFKSRVFLDRPNTITVEYLQGPMKQLSNSWTFAPDGQGGCIIDFYVDFEFKNAVLQSLITVFFNEAVKRMVAAFEDRARVLYSGNLSK